MPEAGYDEGLVRVAFVYDDAAAAAHLRDALAGQVDIAYAATAAEFDAGRATAAGVTAALVNLDGIESIGPLEAALAAAGLRAVFNDPEISAHLDGWERARWLRHLVAKVRGAKDFDPPRPGAAAGAPAAGAQDAGAVERPLSPEEIANLTADFAAPAHAGAVADDAASSLDIDTEALSAMIDARLAEPAALGHDDALSRAVDFEATTTPVVAAAPAPTPGVPAGEDPALPSLGNWALVDLAHPLAASAPAAKSAPAPAVELPSSLADLKLVPMEAMEAARAPSEPTELWMDDAKAGAKSKPKAGEGKS